MSNIGNYKYSRGHVLQDEKEKENLQWMWFTKLWC